MDMSALSFASNQGRGGVTYYDDRGDRAVMTSGILKRNGQPISAYDLLQRNSPRDSSGFSDGGSQTETFAERIRRLERIWKQGGRLSEEDRALLMEYLRGKGESVQANANDSSLLSRFGAITTEGVPSVNALRYSTGGASLKNNTKKMTNSSANKRAVANRATTDNQTNYFGQ